MKLTINNINIDSRQKCSEIAYSDRRVTILF